ncbi:hypothetical protein A6F68_01887 [Tsuneonella dongtanensis]|uniref:DUF4393 domain-containing protein n=1 Tax=Tsuneonella dongtanensis TaxID=692370 RepID=A0A1B2AE32_9SPHN|nr:hypothetical protein [Tsuneonella dongtanensis]ANY20397.1 hypothetical protein A6F68_01887 [Tsuneonella dongtanensis]
MTGDLNINLPDIPEESHSFLRRIFGPLAEVGDLLSDKIRFYRWKSSLETINRAKQIAAEHGFEAQEVPFKTLIPLLENASLEDEASPLIDKWANLLATASFDPKYIENIFISMLSRFSVKELELLERFVCPELISDIGADKEVTQVVLDASVSGATSALVDTISSLIGKRSKLEYRSDLENYIDSLPQFSQHILIEKVGIDFVPFVEDDLYSRFDEVENFQARSILLSEMLLTCTQFRHTFRDFTFYANIVTPSSLGIAFVVACRGDLLPEKVASK